MISRKTLKKIDLENFRSESFSIRTSEGRAPASELVLERGSLPFEIALQGGSLDSKMVYRGVGADFEKPKKYSIIQIFFNNTNFSNFTAAIYKCSKIYNVINK